MSRPLEWTRLAWVAIPVALVGAAISLFVGPLGSLGAPFATVSIAAAVFYAFVQLLPHTVRPRTRIDAPEGARLALLRDAFQSGPMGRETIVSMIETLQRESGLRPGGTGLAPESRREISRLPIADFRQWVDQRLRELEERG